MPKNVLVIIVDCIERFYFFRRFISAFQNLNWKVYLLTDKMSVCLESMKFNCKTILIKPIRYNINFDISKFNDCLEVKAGTLSKHDSGILYESTLSKLREIHSEFEINGIWCWNGSGIIGKVVRDFCYENNIPKLFWEIANIPGKVFVDKEGTNAQSYLYKHIDILDSFDVDIKNFEQWRHEYLNNKIKKHIVPQATKKSPRHITWFRVVDSLASKLRLSPPENSKSYTSRIYEKLLKKIPSINIDMTSPQHDEFVFFPMQVSNDSQLLINSKKGNREAIYYAMSISYKKNIPLYIKPHPAEYDPRFISDIVNMRNDNNLYFVTGNTFSYIKKASDIVIINSSVGLESILLGKAPHFLGQSFIPKLSVKYEYLVNYILNYLISIDYFSDEKVHTSNVNKVLNRMKIKSDDKLRNQ
jgi:capsular polysaccharide export protein